MELFENYIALHSVTKLLPAANRSTTVNTSAPGKFCLLHFQTFSNRKV